MNIAVREALLEDWGTIQSIAYKTWPLTYGDFISPERLNFLLEILFEERSIKNQMLEKKYKFFIADENDQPIGFVSIEENFNSENQVMIHKLYILPDWQGKGLGKIIIDFVTSFTSGSGHDVLRLKVFHLNQKAIEFYEHMGFVNQGSEVTKFDDDFSVLDFVMIKKIVQQRTRVLIL